jgi:hypothetical protein
VVSRLLRSWSLYGNIFVELENYFMVVGGSL